jgi:hypothetical protein
MFSISVGAKEETTWFGLFRFGGSAPAGLRVFTAAVTPFLNVSARVGTFSIPFSLKQF